MRFLFTTFALLIYSKAAFAGGLFGDGGLFRGDIGRFLDTQIEKPIMTPVARGVDETIISPPDLVSPCTTESCGYVTDSPDSISDLEQQQSVQELDLKRHISKEYGVEAGNICLTSRGSCSTNFYVVSGSSCFCEFDTEITVGIIK